MKSAWFSTAAAAAAGFLALGAATQSQALTINATFDSSITGAANSTDIMNRISSAASFYNNFSDPITVNIYFELAPVGLGGSLTSLYYDNYAFYTQIGMGFDSFTHPNNKYLASGLANLGTANQAPNIIASSAEFTNLYDPLFGPGSAPGYLGADGVPFHGTYDGIIYLDNTPGRITWQGDAPAGSYAANPVVQHEIDEVLGLGGPGTTVGRVPPGGDFVGAEDLFRYKGPGDPSYSTDPKEKSYFSFNGGQTLLDWFNQSGTGDYADWAKKTCNGPQHVQDWAGCPGGSQFGLSDQSPEVKGLQALGYNLIGATVPEPGAWVGMILGFGFLGAAARRRRGLASA
jgi:hypothetical protein